MATERTFMHPFGVVIHMKIADQTIMHPFAGVVNAKIEAAGEAPVSISSLQHAIQFNRRKR